MLGNGSSFLPIVQDPDDTLKLYNLSNDEKKLLIAYRAMSDENKADTLNKMKEKLQSIKEEALKAIEQADLPEKLNDVRVKYLGKKGKYTKIVEGEEK